MSLLEQSAVKPKPTQLRNCTFDTQLKTALPYTNTGESKADYGNAFTYGYNVNSQDVT